MYTIFSEHMIFRELFSKILPSKWQILGFAFSQSFNPKDPVVNIFTIWFGKKKKRHYLLPIHLYFSVYNSHTHTHTHTNSIFLANSIYRFTRKGEVNTFLRVTEWIVHSFKRLNYIVDVMAWSLFVNKLGSRWYIFFITISNQNYLDSIS
jgi:hypothetical protein